MSERKTPNLASILANLAKVAMSDVWVSMPARVDEYDGTTGTVTAQPLLKRRYRGEDGELQTESLPSVTHVPVVFFGGIAGRITNGVSTGDVGLLIFVSGSLDRWVARGGEVDPEDDRRNSLSDAVFLTGLTSPAGHTPAHETAGVWECDDIRLGSAAADKQVATKDDLDFLMNAIQSNAGAGVGFGAALAADLTTGNGVDPWPFDSAEKVRVE